MLLAITCELSPSIRHCELTYLERTPIDYGRACAQHERYIAALRNLGLHVTVLPAQPDLPDSVFVEDTALVLPECAILTRPGADSRKPETEYMAKALAPHRRLFHIQSPAHVDGGDILRVGKQIYVGLSTRSDTGAIAQLQEIVRAYGYQVQAVSVTGCLHLKSAVTAVAADTLLINPAWVEATNFKGVKFISTDPSEAYAANALWIEETILYPAAFPKTHARLTAAGLTVLPLEADELAKAEGAVTCCSVIFTA